MNILFALLVAVFSWIVFASMNSLASADGGCCKDNSCGTSFFDHVLWWINLFVSIVFTSYVLLVVNNKYNPYMKATKPLTDVAAAATQMVFGRN